MKCAAAYSTFTCSNTSGTTCTRVAVTIPSINANTTCVAADLVVLTQPEYAAMVTATTTAQNTANTAQSTANTAQTSATGATSGNTSQDGLIATLTTQLASANAAIVSLQGSSGGGGSSTPNPDVIAAEAVIFGVSLTAVALIWGAKRIYKHFSPSVAVYE